MVMDMNQNMDMDMDCDVDMDMDMYTAMDMYTDMDMDMAMDMAMGMAMGMAMDMDISYNMFLYAYGEFTCVLECASMHPCKTHATTMSPANLTITARSASKFCARNRSQCPKMSRLDLKCLDIRRI